MLDMMQPSSSPTSISSAGKRVTPPTTLDSVTANASLRTLVNRSPSAPCPSFTTSSLLSQRRTSLDALAAHTPSFNKSASDSLIQPLYRCPSQSHTGCASTQHHSKMMHHSYYDNQNTTFMMIHRSGGSTVKKIIPMIHERCHAAELQAASDMNAMSDEDVAQPSTAPLVAAPEEECYLLSQWAADSYYKVVICSNGGLAALIRAMQCFPHHAHVQEYACTALAHTCASSLTHQEWVVGPHAHGITHLVHALQHHGGNVAVTSAACDALHILVPVWRTAQLQSTSDQDDGLVQELVAVLQSVQNMYLHPNHKRTAEQLLAAFL